MNTNVKIIGQEQTLTTEQLLARGEKLLAQADKLSKAQEFVDYLREVASNAERIFETVLREKYPLADKFVWLRACEALRNGTADRFDRDMANDPQILRAHDVYIEALHTFYRARDGEGGVLGGRGL